MNNLYKYSKKKYGKIKFFEKKPYTRFLDFRMFAKSKANENQEPLDKTNQTPPLASQNENSSIEMQPLGKGNTGIIFKAQNAKNLPDNITTVWTPANQDEVQQILNEGSILKIDKQITTSRFNANQLNNTDGSNFSPIALLNDKIMIDYPLPEDNNCSYLNTVRYGVRIGGTFIINFYPKNSNHPSIVLSKSGYYRVLSDAQKMQRNNSPLIHQINFENRTENPNIESRLFVRYFLKKKMLLLCQIAIFINPQTNHISKKYTAIGCTFEEFFKIEDHLDNSDSSINTTVFQSYDTEVSMGYFEKN